MNSQSFCSECWSIIQTYTRIAFNLGREQEEESVAKLGVEANSFNPTNQIGLEKLGNGWEIKFSEIPIEPQIKNGFSTNVGFKIQKTENYFSLYVFIKREIEEEIKRKRTKKYIF
jgi:hypothetical protein